MEKFAEIWQRIQLMSTSTSPSAASASSCMWRLLLHNPYLLIGHFSCYCLLLATSLFNFTVGSITGLFTFRTHKVPFVVLYNQEEPMANNNNNSGEQRRARVLIHDNEIEGGDSIRSLDNRDHRIPQVSDGFVYKAHHLY